MAGDCELEVGRGEQPTAGRSPTWPPYPDASSPEPERKLPILRLLLGMNGVLAITQHGVNMPVTLPLQTSTCKSSYLAGLVQVISSKELSKLVLPRLHDVLPILALLSA